MMKEADIVKYIEEMKTPHFRLFDTQGNKLYVYEDGTTAQDAINQLQGCFTMFRGYGKLKVQCATEAQRKRNWKDSLIVTCVFDNAQNISGAQQMNPWAMPVGYVHGDVMMAKLDLITKENNHRYEMMQKDLQLKERDNQDPMKHIEKLVPVVMLAMGKSMDDITKVATVMKIGNSNAAPALPGATAAGSLTFKDVNALPDKEKEEQFQKLADSVATKVSIEEMTLLYQAINDDPTLVATAIQALPLLKKP